jgi:serine/threonine protein kinase
VAKTAGADKEMNNFPDFSSHGYEVINELARNREAGRITYLASNLNLNQKVTIKEFRFASEGTNWSGFKAYEREIEILQQLDHPRIPRYFDSFETPQGFCLVQEYKNAPSLAERRSFTPKEIMRITISVLEILVYLQKRIPPVIHRDIKPENILVDEQLNAYLIDFGLARIGGEQMALSSVAAGTPGFMPPEEQFGRPLSQSSDLYTLGATLICLVTGTRSVNIGRLINEEYRFSFKPLVPQLSPWFVDWLTKMVEPNVRKRFANAEVALSALVESNKLESSPKQNRGDIKVLLLYLMMILSGFAANQLYGGLEYRMNQSKSNQINQIERNRHQSYNPSRLSVTNRNVKLDAAAWVKKGDRLFLRRRYHKALSAYDQALTINPNYYTALIGRCATLNQLSMYEQAFVDCNKAMEISPNNVRLLVARGYVLTNIRKYEESIASYDRAIQINPNYSYAWGGRCSTLNVLRKYQEALPNCDKALELKPDLYWAWDRKGVTLEGLGLNEQALNSYEKALQFEPNYFRSIRNRQRLLEKLGRVTNNQSSVLNKDNFGQAKSPANSEMSSDRNSKKIPPIPKPLCSLNPIFSYQYSTNSILNWQSVPDAKTYTVELDYSIPGLGWCSEKDNCKYTTVSNISTNWYNRSSVVNTSTHQYGYNHRVPPLGRWRVWAVDANGRESPKSAWCEFRYPQ